jgi:hypothetical protein
MPPATTQQTQAQRTAKSAAAQLAADAAMAQNPPNEITATRELFFVVTAQCPNAGPIRTLDELTNGHVDELIALQLTDDERDHIASWVEDIHTLNRLSDSRLTRAKSKQFATLAALVGSRKTNNACRRKCKRVARNLGNPTDKQEAKLVEIEDQFERNFLRNTITAFGVSRSLLAPGDGTVAGQQLVAKSTRTMPNKALGKYRTLQLLELLTMHNWISWAHHFHSALRQVCTPAVDNTFDAWGILTGKIKPGNVDYLRAIDEQLAHVILMRVSIELKTTYLHTTNGPGNVLDASLTGAQMFERLDNGLRPKTEASRQMALQRIERLCQPSNVSVLNHSTYFRKCVQEFRNYGGTIEAGVVMQQYKLSLLPHVAAELSRRLQQRQDGHNQQAINLRAAGVINAFPPYEELSLDKAINMLVEWEREKSVTSSTRAFQGTPLHAPNPTQYTPCARKVTTDDEYYDYDNSPAHEVTDPLAQHDNPAHDYKYDGPPADDEDNNYVDTSHRFSESRQLHNNRSRQNRRRGNRGGNKGGYRGPSRRDDSYRWPLQQTWSSSPSPLSLGRDRDSPPHVADRPAAQSRRPNQQRSSPRRLPGNKCFNCSEEGHWARDCPHELHQSGARRLGCQVRARRVRSRLPPGRPRPRARPGRFSPRERG